MTRGTSLKFWKRRHLIGWSLIVPARKHWQILILVLGATLWLAESAAGQMTVCAPCHRAVWETYRRTAMGRSFYRPAQVTIENATYYHKPSDSYFLMLERGGKIYQRRYQLDASGKQINTMEKRVDYVMGSGNHARTYLHRTPANTLIELPLGWFAEKGGYWAMNPGYDRPNHDGFRRPITYDCMFCHNAYPQIPAGHEQPFAEPIYQGALPEGIDCQRCHGSGTAHVKLAATPGAKREAIRSAIVNPARMSPERQMEGCMACHLETTSFPLPNAVQRYERGPFSYVPGEPLADFILNFDHAPGTGREDKFEIVSAAYRLRRSACFLKSSGKMLCTTCHNPHDTPQGEAAERHYTAACRQCHAQEFNLLVQAGKHTRADGCAACHMPKRRTEDVIHVAVTDHWIQRRMPDRDLLAERTERQDSYRGRVALYYPETLAHTTANDLTIAVAQVIQGSNMTEGIAELTAAIEKYSPQRSEYYLQLAEALRNDGQLGKALPVYREAVRRDPKSAPVLQKFGSALRRAGQSAESAEMLKRAAAIAPEVALTWHELGLTYRAQGKTVEAVGALRKAVAIDPDLAEAHNNLGNLWFAGGDHGRAEPAFREAIRIRPDYADAHGNLANLLSGAGKTGEALEQFAIALGLNASDAATHYNYAVLLGRTGRFEEAQAELERCLRADSAFWDAHVLLGDMLLAKKQTRDAISHYREALRINPESSRAHFGLGAALAMSGDVEAAVVHLRKAAAGTDGGVREQAVEILRQLGR